MCGKCECKKGWLESKIKTMETVDGIRQIVDLPNSVCFVPITTDGKYILGQQFRASHGEIATTLLGGYIDGDDSIVDTAIREMYEETNIPKEYVKSVQYATPRGLYGSMGICNERNYIVEIYLNVSSEELVESVELKSNDPNERINSVVLGKHTAIKELCSSVGAKAFIYGLILKLK